VLVVRSIVGSKVVDTLATTEAVRPAASAAWSIGTSVLVDVAGALIFIGVVVVLAGMLAGHSRWATAARHSLAPYLRDRPDLSFGVLAVLLLILFAWGPIEASRQLTGIVLITVLSVFGLEMLRRQTAAEFPDVAYVGGGDAMRRGMTSMRDAFARGRASLHSGSGHDASNSPTPGDPVERLERLAALHAKGSLTDEEYAAAKRDLIGG
jgi:hypothetical protein